LSPTLLAAGASVGERTRRAEPGTQKQKLPAVTRPILRPARDAQDVYVDLMRRALAGWRDLERHPAAAALGPLLIRTGGLDIAAAAGPRVPALRAQVRIHPEPPPRSTKDSTSESEGHPKFILRSVFRRPRESALFRGGVKGSEGFLVRVGGAGEGGGLDWVWTLDTGGEGVGS
jgi:hypothetical protein